MTRNERLTRWQMVTVVLLVLGYSGYYLCRSDFSVSLPSLTKWLALHLGLSASDAKVRLGTIASLGTLAYAIGKFASGSLADFIGGRRNFLLGMGGSILFTLAFAVSGALPLFTLAWIGNRLVQSLGWVGMVKLTSRWFGFATYGTIMGIISLSYLFGDAAARAFMGKLLEHGFDWRGLFFVAAATLSLLFVANLMLLRESPRLLGMEEPDGNPANVFGAEGVRESETQSPGSLRDLLLPLLRSPAFWFVCLLSLGFTLVRETFLTWTPTYFQEVVGLKPSAASSQSAWFPLLGGVSVLIAGFLSDRLGKSGRALIILVGLLLTTAALFALAHLHFGSSQTLPVIFVALVGFVMIGPYSYLAGAVALDFGGKRGSAAAAGIIDGVGYLGGVLAGDTIARISVAFGWSGAFDALGGVAILSCVAAALYLRNQRQTATV